MALTIDQANAVSKKYFDTTLVQQVYEDSPLFVKLKQKNKIRKKGGNSIQYPIRYLKLDKADAIDAKDQLTYEQLDTRGGASLDWCYYYGQALISWDERVTNAGEAQIIDLMADKAKEMKEDIYDRFATDLFTSNPNGKGIVPLTTILSSATYGGILGTSCTEWSAAMVNATEDVVHLYGTDSLSYAVNAATFGKNKPNFHLTTPDLKSKFESVFEGQKRYEDFDLAKAGFDNLIFKGGPVVSDPHCNTSYWYGLDLNHLEFVAHPDFDFKLVDWFDLKQVGYPNALARVMTWVGNLKCDLRKSNFKYSVLSYAK